MLLLLLFYIKCIKSGCFPNILEVAEVVPLYKVRPNNNCSTVAQFLFLVHLQRSSKNANTFNCTAIFFVINLKVKISRPIIV